MTLKTEFLENQYCVSFQRWTLRTYLGFWRRIFRNREIPRGLERKMNVVVFEAIPVAPLGVKCWDTCSGCLRTQFCRSRFWNLSCWVWSYHGLVLKALFFLP